MLGPGNLHLRHGGDSDSNPLEPELVHVWELVGVEGDQTQAGPAFLEVIDQLHSSRRHS